MSGRWILTARVPIRSSKRFELNTVGDSRTPISFANKQGAAPKYQRGFFVRMIVVSQ